MGNNFEQSIYKFIQWTLMEMGRLASMSLSKLLLIMLVTLPTIRMKNKNCVTLFGQVFCFTINLSIVDVFPFPNAVRLDRIARKVHFIAVKTFVGNEVIYRSLKIRIVMIHDLKN